MKKVSLILLSLLFLFLVACGNSQSTNQQSNTSGQDTGDKTPVPNSEDKKPTENKPLTKVTMADSGTGLIYVPAIIAQENGYFKEEGINLEVVVAGNGADATAAMVGGSAQFATPGLPHVIEGNEGGLSLIAVAPAMTSYALNLVVKADLLQKAGVDEKSSLEDKVKALKGLKLGISQPGASTDKFIRYLCSVGGINPDKDITLVPLGDEGSTLAAFNEGMIDGFARSSPATEKAALQNNGVILISGSRGDVEQFNGYQYTVYATTRAYAEKNPEVVQGFVNALTKAGKFIEENSDKARDIYRGVRGTGISEDIFNEAWKGNYPAIAKDMVITPEQVDVTFKVLATIDGKKTKLGFKDVADPSFAEKAKQTLESWKPSS